MQIGWLSLKMAVSAREDPELDSDAHGTAHFPFKQIIRKEEDGKGILPFLFDSTRSLL